MSAGHVYIRNSVNCIYGGAPISLQVRRDRDGGDQCCTEYRNEEAYHHQTERNERGGGKETH